MRPKVKICGVTSAEEAMLAADLGADFVGLNFYPPSPRYLSPARALEIADAVRGRGRAGGAQTEQGRAGGAQTEQGRAGGAQTQRGRAGGAQTQRGRAGGAQTRQVRLVGVFVNASAAELEETARIVGLDLLQFHGDETPAEIAPFAARAIKAFRVAPEAHKRNGRDRLDAAALEGFEDAWGVLVDAYHPGLYGGTGESWRFESLRELVPQLPRRTFIAGGLGPDNVRAAIEAARPYGIDLCSGVESKPGRKDPELIERLFKEISDGETSRPENPRLRR